MKLLAGLNNYINSHSASDVSDYKLLRKSLEAFLGARDVDVLRLAQPTFIDSYIQFLHDDYRSNKSRGKDLTPSASLAVARRYLKCLRKYVNHLIADTLFPDIDIFSGTQVADDFRRMRRVAPPSVSETLSDMVRMPVSHDSHKMLPSTLRAMYLCGMDPADMAAMTPADFDPEQHRIYLRHLNVWLDYPPQLYDLLSTTTPTSAPIAECGPHFVAFLNLLLQAGISSDPRCLVTLRLATNKKASPVHLTLLRQAVEMLSVRYNSYRRNWYAVKTIGITAQEFAQRLCDSGNPYTNAFVGRPTDIYVPHMPAPKPRSRNKPRIIDRSSVLSHTLFLHAYASDLAHLCDNVRNIYVYRQPGKRLREFMIVPYSEIRTLHLVLSTIGGCQSPDVQDSSAPAIAPGTMVLVQVPDFEGYKAQVTKRNTDGTYTLSVLATSYKVTLTHIPGELLQPISNNN